MSRKPKVDVWWVVRGRDGLMVLRCDTRAAAVTEAGLYESTNPGDGFRAALMVEQTPAAAKELRALRAVARAAEKFERAGFPLGRARAEFVEAVERMRRQSEGVAL